MSLSRAAEWLRRCVQETEWVPHRFELGFGVPLSDGLDPASQEEPARLDCGLALRGAIDLVERRADGGLRVTDYKTGRARVPSGAIVDGGRALQPVLYALAAEKLAEGAPVHSGRLYYCTSGGGFRAVEVPLAEPARRAAQRLATVVGSRIENGNLPQAPHEGACQYCDFTAVCGPHEEARVNEQKPAAGIADLVGLRSLR